MRITTKGQVTIPQSIREELGLLPDTEVDFVVEGSSVRIVKIQRKDNGRGRNIVRKLRGRAMIAMSTDEIMALTRSRS